MDQLTKWFEKLKSAPDLVWKNTLSSRGECHRNVSPRIWYAAVEITISPCNELLVEDKCDPPLKSLPGGLSWYDQIVFGVLDIMLMYHVAPIKNFLLTISMIDFNEIESHAMAFRLAARDAAKKILESQSSTDAANEKDL